MLSSLSLAHLASENTATRDWAKRGWRLRWLPDDSRYAVTSFRSNRLLPGGWVTLQDVYRCTIDAEQFGRKIGEARELADRLCPVRAVIATKDLAAHKLTCPQEWYHILC